MSHVHIGPVVEKKTEEEDIECEDDLFLDYDPENLYRALDYDFGENQPGIMLLTSFFWGVNL